MRCLFVGLLCNSSSFFLGLITEKSQVLVLRTVEARAVLVDVGEVAMAEDAGIAMGFLQATEQAQQSAFLAGCAGVGGFAMRVEAPFVADAERVLVVAYGVGAHQLFVARLVGPAVAGDVVVVARESESFRVTANECCHGKVLVRARGRTVDDNQ